MDFKHKIIQWNCRGLKPNYLKPDDNISLKGFNIYN